MTGEKQSGDTGRYFDLWARDYNQAFQETGTKGNRLQQAVNTLFRRKTFRLRMQQLAEILHGMDLKDKDVLDVGCGSGQVSFLVAGQCRSVLGLDISENMIRICRENLEKLGIPGNVQFRVSDCFNDPLPSADVVLCIAVIEYYRDMPGFIRKLCVSARETLILCDAKRIWWRTWLRKALSLARGFQVFYHDAGRIKEEAAKVGMRCERDEALHSFRTFVFRRDA
ncbi:class I SAM-dependent methyltransferase [bacterium]|nr:class I SAM-dependent methyltransferase [bacterium]